MSANKNRIINAVLSIIILLLSLAVMIIDFAVPSVNILIHPVLTFLLCLFTGFGLMYLCLGITRKSAFSCFLGAILIGFALFYLLICLTNWWIALISVIVLWLIMGLINTIICGNSADDCAMNKDGDDYKSYQERKEEIKEENNSKEELPTLKSFKD
jgi:flagellar basal body-associated protein FliL